MHQRLYLAKENSCVYVITSHVLSCHESAGNLHDSDCALMVGVHERKIIVVSTKAKVWIVVLLLLLSLVASAFSLLIPNTIYANAELRDVRYGWPVPFISQDSSRFSLGGDGPPLPYVKRIWSPWENPTTILPVQLLINIAVWCVFLWGLVGWFVYRQEHRR